MSEYIEFVETGSTGKTEIFEVRSVAHCSVLGVVKWYGPWRQYVFFPVPTTVWNQDCLNTIITFLNGLMAARAVKKRPSGGHTYTLVGDMQNVKCDICGKPYNELDVPEDTPTWPE